MIRWTGHLLPAVTLLAVGLPLCAVEKTSPSAPQVLPGGGVADPAGKVGYFPGKNGGIAALDLANGQLLWNTQTANRPLLATRDRLVARAPVRGKANQLRVVVLDTGRKGKLLLEARPVVFPAWVSVEAAYGRSFACTARLAGERLFLTWSARAWYAGGAAPPPEVERAARKEASGVARIDLRSGKVESLKGGQVPDGVPRQAAGEVQTTRLKGMVYSIVDMPGGDRRRPFQKRRFVRAADASGKVLWEHEIAAPVYLPPLP